MNKKNVQWKLTPQRIYRYKPRKALSGVSTMNTRSAYAQDHALLTQMLMETIRSFSGKQETPEFDAGRLHQMTPQFDCFVHQLLWFGLDRWPEGFDDASLMERQEFA